jgi:cathepsin D
MAAFERNTGRPHPLVGGIITSSKRSTGSDQLTDYYAELWYGTISIGSPAKDFTGVFSLSPVQNWPSDLVLCTVDFDTGSSDLFVPSINCDSSCSGHEMYDPSASSTSHDLGKNFSLTYGDGSTVSGEQYSDTVSIAGLVAR